MGNPELAHDRLTNALDVLMSPRDSVQRGIVGADLALARLRLGHPPGCAALMHDCVDITASTEGRVSAIRVRQVRQALRPWRAEGFVAELDDHIYQALIWLIAFRRWVSRRAVDVAEQGNRHLNLVETRHALP